MLVKDSSESLPMPTFSKFSGSLNFSSFLLKTKSRMIPLRDSLVPAIPLNVRDRGSPPKNNPPSPGASMSLVPFTRREAPISTSSKVIEIRRCLLEIVTV